MKTWQCTQCLGARGLYTFKGQYTPAFCDYYHTTSLEPRSSELFEDEPEAETSRNVIRKQNARSGRTNRFAAVGETTGPDKRTVDSHVRPRSAGRSSPRGATGNRGSSSNDPIETMKNLDDYLPKRFERKTPIEIFQTPIISPDTLDALRRAENLIKDARKTVLEARYDVASSPECEESIRSAGNGEPKDEDAVHIREIVATRFYLANESARIFTRPFTRPLTERLCGPTIRQKRTKRIRDRYVKINDEETTMLRPKSVQRSNAIVRKNLKNRSDDLRGFSKKNVVVTQRKKSSVAMTKRTVEDHDQVFPCRSKIDNGNVSNAFVVQQGPAIDIRNELTITNVEKVDITPEPLPVRKNARTYEFRHDYRDGETIDEAKDRMEKSVSTISETMDRFVTRETTKIHEDTNYPMGKRRDDVATLSKQSSKSDVVENELIRTISTRRIDGLGNDDFRTIDDRVDHPSNEKQDDKFDDRDERNIGCKKNGDEWFIDFLRRFENLKTKETNSPVGGLDVFRNLRSNEKINIFDRAVDRFVEEIGGESSKELRKDRSTKTKQNGVRDGVANVDASRRIEDFVEEEFSDDEYFEESWDLKDVELQPPNIVGLEKILKTFGGRIDEIIVGTKNLGSLVSKYFVEAGVSSDRDSIDRQCSNFSTSLRSVPTKNISNDSGLKNIEEKNHLENIANRETRDETKISVVKIGSRDNSDEISIDRHCQTDTKPDVVVSSSMKKKIVKNRHSKFSTPLNDNSKMLKFRGSNDDCRSNEFDHFLNGIHGSKDFFTSNQRLPSRCDDLTKIHSGDNILTNRHEFVSPRSVVTNNDLKMTKKMVIDEIEDKCNLDCSLVSERSRRSDVLEKTHEIKTFLNSPITNDEKDCHPRNIETRSLIQDSTIGRLTDRTDGISVDEKFTDESRGKKKLNPSERCESCEKNICESTKFESAKSSKIIVSDGVVDDEKIESSKTKSLTMGKNFVETSRTMSNNEKKLTEASKLKTIDGSKKIHDDNGFSVEDEETMNNKKRSIPSIESSSKDRTSFDVSTAYSDDFRESAVDDRKSKSDEKIASNDSRAFETISNRVEIAEAKEIMLDCEKKNDKSVIATLSTSKDTSDSGNESKDAKCYLEKSVSVSVRNSWDKIEEGEEKKNDDQSRSVESTTKEKKLVDCNSTMKEDNEIVPKVSGKSCKDGCSGASTFSSTKGSAKRSLGETLRKEIKISDACSDNYSEGELYLPSSCSYSLGEIRIDERGSCGTAGSGISSTVKNSDGIKIYYGNKNSDRGIKDTNSLVVSPGEVQGTDIESICSSQGVSSDGEHHMGKPYILQLKTVDT